MNKQTAYSIALVATLRDPIAFQAVIKPGERRRVDGWLKFGRTTMRWLGRLFLAAGTTLILLLPSKQAGAQQWRLVRGGITFGISGMALLQHDGESTSFVIVHDNKCKGEPRAAILTIQGSGQPQYTPLEWPDGDSAKDLEAISAVPGCPGSFMALTSGGRIYHLRLNARRSALSTIAVRDVPNQSPHCNFEGFTLQKIGGTLIAVWADRGENEKPAVVYWGLMNLPDCSISQVRSTPLIVPWPLTNVRHVSDIKVDVAGAIFVSSASDPGNAGPFESAFYLAGTLDIRGGSTNLLQNHALVRLRRFSYHKVEAFEFVPGATGCVIFASDDEDMGSMIYPD